MLWRGAESIYCISWLQPVERLWEPLHEAWRWCRSDTEDTMILNMAGLQDIFQGQLQEWNGTSLKEKVLSYILPSWKCVDQLSLFQSPENYIMRLRCWTWSWRIWCLQGFWFLLMLLLYLCSFFCIAVSTGDIIWWKFVTWFYFLRSRWRDSDFLKHRNF